jgi:UDP-glucose 4-epimerase
VLSLRYFNPVGADPKMRSGLQLRRPTHALGSMIHALDEGVPFAIAINLGNGNGNGNGNGTTVRELLDMFNRVSDRPVRALETGRRPGDTAGAYTRIDRAARLPAWKPQYHIVDGIRHSLQWAAMREVAIRT